jgi:hypothetical protein
LAAEPKNIRESNFAMAGLEGRLTLIQAMVWSVIGLIGALIAGAFALYLQLGEIKTDVAVLKNTLGTIKEQQAKIEEGLRSIESKTLGSLSRIENRLASNQPPPAPDPKQDDPLNLSAEDIATIREILKPQPTGNQLTVRVGDVAQGVLIPILPSAVTDKIPRLRNYRYTIDRQSGAVLIVSNRTLRILEIIS